MSMKVRELQESSGRMEAQTKSLTSKVAENINYDQINTVKSRVFSVYSASVKEDMELRVRRNRNTED